MRAKWGFRKWLPSPLSVFPAQAGIQDFARIRKSLKSLDSHFHGNDGEETAFLIGVADYANAGSFWKAPCAGKTERAILVSPSFRKAARPFTACLLSHNVTGMLGNAWPLSPFRLFLGADWRNINCFTWLQLRLPSENWGFWSAVSLPLQKAAFAWNASFPQRPGADE